MREVRALRRKSGTSYDGHRERRRRVGGRSHERRWAERCPCIAQRRARAQGCVERGLASRGRACVVGRWSIAWAADRRLPTPRQHGAARVYERGAAVRRVGGSEAGDTEAGGPEAGGTLRKGGGAVGTVCPRPCRTRSKRTPIAAWSATGLARPPSKRGRRGGSVRTRGAALGPGATDRRSWVGRTRRLRLCDSNVYFLWDTILGDSTDGTRMHSGVWCARARTTATTRFPGRCRTAAVLRTPTFQQSPTNALTQTRSHNALTQCAHTM